MANQLGNYLRGLREAKGMTTRQLSNLAGCSQPFITYVEMGERLPTLIRLWQMVRALEGNFSKALFLLCLDSGIPEEVAREIVSKHHEENR